MCRESLEINQWGSSRGAADDFVSWLARVCAGGVFVGYSVVFQLGRTQTILSLGQARLVLGVFLIFNHRGSNWGAFKRF